MKTEKLLVDENKQGAEQRIAELRQTAASYTTLIAAYNALPVLTDITTAEQAKDFLTDPIKYLDTAVLTDTGFKSRITPNVSKVGELYGINYGQIQQKIVMTRVNTILIPLFSFDESSLKIELMPESEEKIKEESKIYLSDPKEIEEYNKVKQLCNDLISYFTRYHLDAISMNQIPSATGLRCVGKRPGPGYMLIPSVEMIRELNK